jgi:hypothetical protein
MLMLPFLYATATCLCFECQLTFETSAFWSGVQMYSKKVRLILLFEKKKKKTRLHTKKLANKKKENLEKKTTAKKNPKNGMLFLGFFGHYKFPRNFICSFFFSSSHWSSSSV